MRVLVTGATGFVGRSLVRRLLAEGHEVTGTYRGHQPPNVSGVRWCFIDNIGPKTDWSEGLAGVHGVIHLAALAHQVGRKGEKRAGEFNSVNTQGAATLAEAARSSPTVRKFIFVSSIGAVSGASARALDEETACRPITDYGRSKLEAEIALRRILSDSQIEWCILRPPLVYGPSNPGNMARLTTLLRTEWPLPFGGIKNQRSFIYVENFVDALVTCLVRPHRAGESYFITDGSEFSTRALSMLLGKHLGLRVRLWNVPVPLLKTLGFAGDILQAIMRRSVGIDTYSVDRLIGSLWADGSKFRNVFGWRPPFTPEEGIAATCVGILNRSE